MSHAEALSRFHAPITAPGRRLLRFVPLRSVVRKVVGRGGRSVNLEIPLIPFIDFLLCIVCFLLSSFSAEGDIPPDKHVQMPKALNVMSLLDAPIVALTGNQILVDGVAAGNTRAIEDANRLARIDELFNQLRSKRELWQKLNPGREFPGAVTLQVDRHVPALVVKSVFQTAAMAGYPAVSFQVGRLGNTHSGI